MGVYVMRSWHCDNATYRVNEPTTGCHALVKRLGSLSRPYVSFSVGVCASSLWGKQTWRRTSYSLWRFVSQFSASRYSTLPLICSLMSCNIFSTQYKKYKLRLMLTSFAFPIQGRIDYFLVKCRRQPGAFRLLRIWEYLTSMKWFTNYRILIILHCSLVFINRCHSASILLLEFVLPCSLPDLDQHHKLTYVSLLFSCNYTSILLRALHNIKLSTARIIRYRVQYTHVRTVMFVNLMHCYGWRQAIISAEDVTYRCCVSDCARAYISDIKRRLAARSPVSV